MGTGSYMPTLEERVNEHLAAGTDSLYICKNAWALRHRFINQVTGEAIRARCDSWRCLYCGPRKVDLWRQLILSAQPTHFVTLTKVGMTVEEAARVLTTVVQRLRRGTRIEGRKGFRDAYPIEYFTVLERHKQFEENGFHWHLLVKGVEFLPNQAVSEALRSATKGRSYITRVLGVRNHRAVGYVTKYLTKDISRAEQGIRMVEREMIELGLDENGQVQERRTVVLLEATSKARRIRYSRHFFPESVADLRAKLFAGINGNDIDIDTAAVPVVGSGTENGKHVEDDEKPVRSSGWTLYECAPVAQTVEEYQERRREVLQSVLEERQANGRRHARRLLTIWGYQRRELLDSRDDEKLIV